MVRTIVMHPSRLGLVLRDGRWESPGTCESDDYHPVLFYHSRSRAAAGKRLLTAGGSFDGVPVRGYARATDEPLVGILGYEIDPSILSNFTPYTAGRHVGRLSVEAEFQLAKFMNVEMQTAWSEELGRSVVWLAPYFLRAAKRILDALEDGPTAKSLGGKVGTRAFLADVLGRTPGQEAVKDTWPADTWENVKDEVLRNAALRRAHYDKPLRQLLRRLRMLSPDIVLWHMVVARREATCWQYSPYNSPYAPPEAEAEQMIIA